MIRLRNTLYDSHPIVLHCPSSEVRHHLWDRAVTLMLRYSRVLPSPANLSIITWNNKEIPGSFETSTTKNGLDCTILGKGLMPWTNRCKIGLTKAFADTCQSDYILGVDSFDAILVDNPAKAVKVLQNSGVEMIFNGSIMSYPPVPPFSTYEKSINKGVFCHLNAGVWVATTKFCREFFGFAAAFEDDDNTKKFPFSEQVVVRAILPNFKDKVKIDSECEIFQTIEFPNVYPEEHANSQYIELGAKALVL